MSTEGAELHRVKNLGDANLMRVIRNECRDFMTNNTARITYSAQVDWWRMVKGDPDWACYLLYFNRQPVGYGIVRRDGGRCWVTGGLIEAARGRGLGRWLFARLTELAGCDCWAYLEVRADNRRAIGLYRSLGYRQIGEPRPGILLMRASPG